jgi:hypothetical protein
MQEELLLSQTNDSEQGAGELNSQLNRTLRCIAAHLQRYGSELQLLAEIIAHVSKWRQEFLTSSLEITEENRPGIGDMPLQRLFDQMLCNVTSMKRFEEELQHKTESLLALVTAPRAE